MKAKTVSRVTKSPKPPLVETFAELWERLGKVPLHRIRMEVPPGQATVKDVARLLDGPAKRRCELVDGVLVELAMGWKEAILGMYFGFKLVEFVERHDLGLVLGEGGATEIFTGQVRIPDVAFYGWHHFPRGELPDEPIPYLFPDLAVEVISISNTPGEMQRKLSDYFKAGVKLVWYLYPKKKQVEVYTSPEECVTLKVGDTLSGDPVLPGFTISVAQLFVLPSRRRRGRR
jgi:Uma2 family endonuclease